ncbi:MAG: SPOR domain-containing protein [Sideroxydans sp.]
MAKQIRTDDEFNLQRQARRRLIGAIALMLAVVIFLPMIFDADPGATVKQDIELRIPEKAAPLPAAESAPQEVEATAADAVPAPLPVAAAEPAPAPVVVAMPMAQPVEKPLPKPEAKPVVKQAPAAPAKPASKHAGWVVQVGAYSKADAAKQMAANLKQRGYPVYTEQASGMVRVRVGSYPDKAAADKVRAKLEAIGLHPNVLNLE